MRKDHTPTDSRTFVFGSNLLGIHGAGAALYAKNKLGAELGVYEGPTGRTYALPTCVAPGEPMTLEEIRYGVEEFLDYAAEHSNEQFYVSAVGCGFAGFTEQEIAPLFDEAPPNCDLPDGWRNLTDASRSGGASLGS